MVTSLLVGVLFGSVWVLPALTGPTPPGLCKSLNTLKNSLNFTHRRQFMKHNFPIDYAIRVHSEEVFNLRNISKLRANVQGLEMWDLQDLWFIVNQEVLKKVLRVLPEKHPSRRFTFELEQLFRMVQQVFAEVEQTGNEREAPARIQRTIEKIRDPKARYWKLEKPKSLLDHCYRTMHCLFTDCFPDGDGLQKYCDWKHWRKGKKKLMVTA